MKLSGVTIKSIYESWVRYQCAKIYSIKRGWLALPDKSEMTKNFLFVVMEVISRGSFVLSFLVRIFKWHSKAHTIELDHSKQFLSKILVLGKTTFPKCLFGNKNC